MMTGWVQGTALTLVGACLGSFAATAILRSTRGEQAMTGRSRCDGCGAPLSFLQTVPIIAYVSARGVCHRCGATIDPAHLAGEIAGAAIMLAALSLAPVGRAALLLTLGLALLASAIHDARTQRLPDALTLAIAVAGAALAGLRSTTALVSGLVMASVMFAGLEILRWGYRRLRGRPGLGFGDVKLIAALALWLGVATPWAITLAAGGSLLFARWRPSPDGRLAFGPFLAPAGFVIGAIGEAIPWR